MKSFGSNWTEIFLLIFTTCVAVIKSDKDTFSDLSDSSFSDIQCVPYAYGDFNADKLVDIFCVSEQGKQFEIWLAQEKQPLFTRNKNFIE
jgi:hypothetical protein